MTEREKSLFAEVTAAKDAYRAGKTAAIRMSRAAYNSIHRDFRSSRGDSSYPSSLCLCDGMGTCLVSVEFTEEVK
jgi:hypothetical protein